MPQLECTSKLLTLDILPTRQKMYLHTYFSRYTREERLKVEYFIIDMWDD